MLLELENTTPLVVYMKTQRPATPPKSPKIMHVDVVKLTTPTPMKANNHHLISLLNEEKLQAKILADKDPNQDKPVLRHNGAFMTELYGPNDNTLAKDRILEPTINSHSDDNEFNMKRKAFPSSSSSERQQFHMPLNNPSPTVPITLKEWSGRAAVNYIDQNNRVDTRARFKPESFSVEQVRSQPGNVRTIETAATPYDPTKNDLSKKHHLIGIPASIWQGFYDSMNRWYHGDKKNNG